MNRAIHAGDIFGTPSKVVLRCRVLSWSFRWSLVCSCGGRKIPLPSGKRKRHWLLRVLSFRITVQQQLEPVALPIETLHELSWRSCPRQVVVASREDHELGGHSKMRERAEPLLALLQRDSLIVVGVQDQGRGLHLRSVADGRVFPVKVGVFKQVTAEILGMAVRSVACAIDAEEV